VPDSRLIDYPVALPSTPASPALDGALGNTDRLKEDLDALGIFNRHMSFYSLFRQRLFGSMGFAGFEARHYSLFPSLTHDLPHAANLQMLITSLAFKYIVNRQVDHAHIPDTPFVESERRQAFFAAAAGVPTFYVRRDTGNRFLLDILARTRAVRYSHRYKGYLRVTLDDYRRALLDVLREDAADLIEMNGMTDTMADLAERVSSPATHSAFARISRKVVGESGRRNWQSLTANEFNGAAERYYREEARQDCLREGLDALRYELRQQASHVRQLCDEPFELDETCERDLLAGTLSPRQLVQLIRLLVATETPQAAAVSTPMEHAV
jgi:hypothetical protein